MKNLLGNKVVRGLLEGFLLTAVILICLSPLLSRARNSGNVEDIPSQYETVSVTISEGDRAWNIQEELTPDKDIREMLYYVNVVNDRQVGSLQIGEKILFLKEVE